MGPPRQLNNCWWSRTSGDLWLEMWVVQTTQVS